MIVYLDGRAVPMCERCFVTARQPDPEPGVPGTGGWWYPPTSVAHAVEHLGWVVRKRALRRGGVHEEHLCDKCKRTAPKPRRKAVAA